MKDFTQQDLTEFDGNRDEGQVYIARDGKVYDVTDSKLWKGGMHMKRHQAGQDLTQDFPAAPHGEEVFEKFKQVGTLRSEPAAPDQELPATLSDFLQRHPFFRHHPHPMIVHFPIVFMFAATGFVLVALVTGNQTFETTAFHCLGAGLVFTPLAMATGFLTWWINYRARPIRPVSIKIWVSLLVLLDTAVVFSWRLLEPEILVHSGPRHYLYIVLICALAPLVSVIGWFGAQLTFPLANAKTKED